MRYLSRDKLLLMIILLVFLLPIAASSLLFYSGFRTKATTNQGLLIQPPATLRELPLHPYGNTVPVSLKGHWQLILLAPQPCAQACWDNLYKLRQVHTALGKDQGRVQRMIISSDQHPLNRITLELIAHDYRGTRYFVASDKHLHRFFNTLSTAHTLPSTTGIFLADPHGNLVMFYPLAAPPKALFEDLGRLLSLSKIG